MSPGFFDLVQTVGLPWAVAFTVAVILARVIVVMWKDANRRTDERIADLKNQLAEMTEDRNFHRERLFTADQLNEQQAAALKALVAGGKKPPAR